MTEIIQIGIATNNPDKVRELTHALQDMPIQLVAPPPDYVAPEETGHTCEENALLKARTLSVSMNIPALADDTGLFVEALSGKPGIYSSRYAGPNATYADNVKKLLGDLEGVARDDRIARFVCIIALVWPHGRFELIRGDVEGLIAEKARGSNGFGYDPIFLFPEQNRTFAEMSLEEKEAVSHRGHALAKLRERLAFYLKQDS